jgi:hypothetical protein
VTILYFSASPIDSDGYRLSEDESRALRRVVEQGALAPSLHFAARSSARVDDLQRELNRLKPLMFHFGGHGTPDGLVCQADADNPQLLSAEALARILAACEPIPRVVVLNACHTEVYAPSVARVVECVVGMPPKLDDRAAHKFALAFYDALVAGLSVQAAYRQGLARLSAHALPDEPTLHVRPGIDPAVVTLAHASPAAGPAQVPA